MTEQQYTVAADRDRGDIIGPVGEGDRVTYGRDGWGKVVGVRIERPVPTSEEDTTQWHREQDARLHRMRALYPAKPYPHPPTREQIAERKRVKRLVERVGRDLDRDVYHATGQESDVRDLRLVVLALIQNGADRG